MDVTWLVLSIVLIFATFLFTLMFSKGDGVERLALAGGLAWGMTILNALGWMIYVAAHFINKYW